jgi:hypothetical protein
LKSIQMTKMIRNHCFGRRQLGLGVAAAHGLDNCDRLDATVVGDYKRYWGLARK